MFTIRPLTESDLPGLLALYAELYPVPTDPERMQENFRRMASRPDYLVVGAFSEQGQLVGSALAVICLDIIAGCQPWAMIENVITTERVRGQGVGRMVLGALEEFARRQGCSYIQLTTSKRDAHGFYTAVGYSGDVVRAFRKSLQ